MSALPPEEMDLVAAELALGLLDGTERAAAEERLADPAFAARHALWRARAVAIAAATASRPAPLTVWPAIERLTRKATAGRAPALRWWQGAAAVAAAAAIVLAVMLARLSAQPPVTIVRPVPAPAPMIAVLTAPKGDASVAVIVDPARAALTLAADRFDAGRRAAELWVIPSDGRPRSIGLMPQGARARLGTAAEARAELMPGVTLAVSLEPPGGSPTGRPTGPVVLSGKIVAT